MISSFESQTHKVTEYEIKTLIPRIINSLGRRVGKQNAVTAKQMVSGLTQFGFKTSGPRVRVMIAHIRRNNLLSRVAGSGVGYYVEPNDKKWTEYLNGYATRIKGQLDILNKLQKQ